VQSADHHDSVSDVAQVQPGHAGVALRLRFDQPIGHETGERFPHGRPRQPESLGEVGVTEDLARRQHAGDDGIADLAIRLITKEGAPDRFNTHI